MCARRVRFKWVKKWYEWIENWFYLLLDTIFLNATARRRRSQSFLKLFHVTQNFLLSEKNIFICLPSYYRSLYSYFRHLYLQLSYNHHWDACAYDTFPLVICDAYLNEHFGSNWRDSWNADFWSVSYFVAGFYWAFLTIQ